MQKIEVVLQNHSKMVKGLKYRITNSTLIVGGKTNTFYQKQLLQENLKKEFPEFKIMNEVSVS
jgi:hypothetical protein